MKNLLHNIQILPVLALMMAGIQSCSDDLPDAGDVQVNFTATLPTDTRTRSFGEAEQVNTLVVGVFDEQTKEIYRKSFPINGTSANVQLTLAQEQTYSFVFWAYHYDGTQSIYDITNLTAIKMNELPETITFTRAEAMDAFFATMKDVPVTGNCDYPVELVRPLAQINVGTTGTPMQATLKVEDVPNIFHPFTKTVSGSAEFTWVFSETTTEKFAVKDKDGNETVYNYLAMGYVFAPTTAEEISAALTLTDGDASETVEFPQVEIQANQRSNIAGNFTTENY